MLIPSLSLTSESPSLWSQHRFYNKLCCSMPWALIAYNVLVLGLAQFAVAQESDLPLHPTNAKAEALLQEAISLAKAGNFIDAEAKAALSGLAGPSCDTHIVHLHSLVHSYLKLITPDRNDPLSQLQRVAADLRANLLQSKQYYRPGAHDASIADLQLATCDYVQGLHVMILDFAKKSGQTPNREMVDGLRMTNREVGRAFRDQLERQLRGLNVEQDFVFLMEKAEQNESLFRTREFLEKLLAVATKHTDGPTQRMLVTTMWKSNSFRSDGEMRKRVLRTLCTFNDESLRELEKHRTFAKAQQSMLQGTIGSLAAIGEIPADLKADEQAWRQVIEVLDVVCVRTE